VSAWGPVTALAAAIVLLHVVGYLAVGVLLVVAGPRRLARLRTWLARAVPATRRG
jgi:hypothetical protein